MVSVVGVFILYFRSQMKANLVTVIILERVVVNLYVVYLLVIIVVVVILDLMYLLVLV